MSVPSATVVIPCFNHGRFVAEAVRSCLAQVDADIRVVIVNDGSDDGSTPEACDRCVELGPQRVAVVHQKNRGLSAARNRGALEAKNRAGEWAGEYLVFLDADDWIEPTFVSKLHGAIVKSSVETRAARREAKLVAAGAESSSGSAGSNGSVSSNGTHETAGAGSAVAVIEFSPAGKVSHAYCQEKLVDLCDMTWAVPEWDPSLMMVTNLHPVTALVRRECFEAVGGFDESMREGYEDWDLWLKFVERGWKGVRVREPLFIWRRHSATTMIVEAGKRHERLFGQLVTNHIRLYMRHGPELLVLSNRLLRQSDANWLDESGEAIVVRDTRNLTHMLAAERDAARNEIGVLHAAAQSKDAAWQQREQSLQSSLHLSLIHI